MRSAAGRDVLLIDADDQETASDFTILRNERMTGRAGYTSIKLTGPAVRTEILRLVDKYADIIIDTGGRDTTSHRAALSVAHCSFDVWTLEKVGALVAEMRTANPALNACAFLNRADPRGQDNDDAAVALQETAELRFLDTRLELTRRSAMQPRRAWR
jgi:chromosome partitioning protein